MPASAATAQGVTGLVVDSLTGVPAVGAIVALATPEGRRLGAVQAGPDGRYRLTAPSAGAFRLRVDRIGFEGWQSPVFDLGATETRTLDVRLSVRRVDLDAVAVEGTAQCTVNPDAAPRTLATWEEIRRALTLSDLAQRHGAIPVELRTTERLMTGRGEVAGYARHARLRGSATRPWEAPPPEELAARGYARLAGDSVLYFGPSIETLLSESFLATHCFSLVRRGTRQSPQLGLAFRPLATRRLPDIAGTIWLDQRSSELRLVEFTFEHTADSLGNGEPPNGRLEFARLPSGLWFIERWTLRVPLVSLHAGDPSDPDVAWERRRRRRSRSLMDEPFRESSGVAVVLTGTGGSRDVGAATISGTVVDSTTGAPLAGVQVVAPGALAVTTDGAGQYLLRIEDAPSVETAYTVTFLHARFELLGLGSTTRVTAVRAGAPSTLHFATPSVATLLQSACPLEGEAVVDATGALRLGMVIGQVATADGAPPPAGTRVMVEWGPADTGGADGAGSAGGSGVLQRRATSVREDGRFHLCPLPLGTELELRALHEGRVLGSVSVTVPGSGLALYELSIPPTTPR